MSHLRAAIVSGIFVGVAIADVTASDSDGLVDFKRDVRPILADHCFECHGPDDAQRKAKLRLDVKSAAFEDRDGFFAVIPGDADESMIIERVESDFDPMPPEDYDEQLSDAEKKVLRDWVAQGAKWSDHWAFEPIARPDVPVSDGDGWVRDPIDAFAARRHAAAGVSPEPETSRERWLRRVTFDLTGLPPTPDELDAFLGDDDEGAYERQVDRLLASKRYGERQAQDWLDLARYADTNGNQFDEPRSMFKWRDWVIDAYNANIPFDRFTVEQLAGDLLPSPTQSQLIATGFNRNHPTDTDGPSEQDEYRTEYVMDRVHTTATTWMGLTLGCAQCHDHKYDPFTMKDYYSFYAFFNNVAERDIDYGNPRPRLRVANPDQEPLLGRLTAQIEEIEAHLESDDPLLDRGQAEWEDTSREKLGEEIAWRTVEPVGMLARNGSWLKQLADGSVLAHGPTPVQDVYDLVMQPGQGEVQALRLEVLPLPDDEEGHTGRGQKGQFNLSRLEIRDSSLSEGRERPLVYIAKAGADFDQERNRDAEEWEDVGGLVSSAVAYPKAAGSDEGGGGGGDFGFGRRGGWSYTGDARKEPREAVFVPLEPLTMNDASVLKIAMHQTGGRYKSLIGRFRWSVTDDPRVRNQLLPVAPKLWSTLGPFPAKDVASAFGTAFEPEASFEDGVDRRKRYKKPELPKEEKDKKGKGKKDGGKGSPDAKDAEVAKADAKPDKPDKKKGEVGDEAKNPAGDAKPDAVAQADVKPEAEPKPEADEDDGDDDDDGGFGRRRRDTRLAWTEQRSWVDGERQRLSASETSAWYLTREVMAERAGTAMLRLDGPPGVKVWLNGEVVLSEEPPPPKPPVDEKKKKKADDGDDDGDDFFDFRRRDEDDGGDRKVRIGLREGRNELVVKAVFEVKKSSRGSQGGGGGFGGFGRSSGGASVTFDLTPEGGDVLTWEVVKALRAGAAGSETAQVETASTWMDDEPRKGGPNAESVELADMDKAPRASTATMERPTPERDRAALRDHYREHVSTFGRMMHEELARLKKEKRDLERKLPETMIMGETDAEKRRETAVLMRGDFRRRGEQVETRTPEALPPMPDDLPRDRLGLAKWLVSGDHPLTARVTVNRIWQKYFGVGLVKTANDFGVRGELPSHPELLDYLASEFMASGWDLKALHRRIVLSSTYRQRAEASAEKRAIDPENRLLARGPRARLSAEMIRDNALAVSGLLVEEVGGKSVKPYQAKGLWSEVTGGRDYKRDKGEKQYRRGLYVYQKRRVPYASMATFDASTRETCVVTRSETITPLQALVLLNNPVYVEAAKMFGQRMLELDGDDDARLRLGFRLVTSRVATDEELDVLRALLVEQRAAFTDEKAAKKLLSVGDAKVDDKLDAKELAAWTGVAGVLLNLDATIHKG